MMLALLGLGLAFGIGVACRLLFILVRAPPRIEGALLVVAMTLGFLLGDRLLG